MTSSRVSLSAWLDQSEPLARSPCVRKKEWNAREFEVRHAPPEFDLLKPHLTELRAGIQVTHPSDHAELWREWRSRPVHRSGSNKSCS